MNTIPVNAHFLEKVRQGARPGCDSIARDCRNFARAVHEHAITLDAESAKGLVEWIAWAREFPTAARHYLEQD